MKRKQPRAGITGIACTLLDDDTWELAVTKAFAPEYGGDVQTSRYNAGPQLHHALSVAREIIAAGSPCARDRARESKISKH
jgi:hypothetical protein